MEKVSVLQYLSKSATPKVKSSQHNNVFSFSIVRLFHLYPQFPCCAIYTAKGPLIVLLAVLPWFLLFHIHFMTLNHMLVK